MPPIPISPLVLPDPFPDPGGIRLSKEHAHIEVLSIHDVKDRFRQFTGQRLAGHDAVALPLLPVVPGLHLRLEAGRERRRLDERPGQMRIPIAPVVFALLFAVKGSVL